MTLHQVMKPEHEAASILIQTAPRDIEQAIEQQRAMKAMGNFSLDLNFSGLLERVAFERAAGGADNPSSRIKGVKRMVLDFGSAGPRIIFSADRSTLLVVGRIPRELPDVTDPGWQPKYTLGIGETAPMISQRWQDLISGTWDRFLVFQPLVQVIYQASSAQWGSVQFVTGQKPFPHALLLADPDEGDAYFVGGVLQHRMSG